LAGPRSKGIAREFFEFWEQNLKSRGFRLRVQILDFPGGKPGDVGAFLSWKPRPGSENEADRATCYHFWTRNDMDEPKRTQHEKYERLIAKAKQGRPPTVAVAHPCDQSSLEGAVDAARLGLIAPDPCRAGGTHPPSRRRITS